MQPNELAVGDTFTIDNQYAKRTFMQWLKREPKKLQQYVVKANNEVYMAYEKAKLEERNSPIKGFSA